MNYEVIISNLTTHFIKTHKKKKKTESLYSIYLIYFWLEYGWQTKTPTSATRLHIVIILHSEVKFP